MARSMGVAVYGRSLRSDHRPALTNEDFGTSSDDDRYLGMYMQGIKWRNGRSRSDGPSPYQPSRSRWLPPFRSLLSFSPWISASEFARIRRRRRSVAEMASSSSIPTASAAVGKLSSSLPPAAAAAPSQPALRVSFRLSSVPAKLVFRSSQALKICSGRSTFVKAQMNEVAGSSSNDAAPAKSNVEIPRAQRERPSISSNVWGSSL
ncbi:uncharacterized protein LOC120257559 [Dioscorea cayenensis subsp. rotundata]|uniref:Uncharacterized protein LOC120257559 n=1 Tax=Dioscorea cayennensis subsp. rotundata TaxID=55577 RepID=A0AB40B108_DIOCR|nr:uncharacterized protein LOC120257559 [Dioscorea cayenensis subsp. rotundata]